MGLILAEDECCAMLLSPSLKVYGEMLWLGTG